MTIFSRSLLFAGLLAVIPVAAEAGPRYALEVNGLSCPFCAYSIEKTLNRLEGVESLTTHVGEGRVVVEMRDGASLTRDEAEEAVEEAGFSLVGFDEAPGDSVER